MRDLRTNLEKLFLSQTLHVLDITRGALLLPNESIMLDVGATAIDGRGIDGIVLLRHSACEIKQSWKQKISRRLPKREEGTAALRKTWEDEESKPGRSASCF